VHRDTADHSAGRILDRHLDDGLPPALVRQTIDVTSGLRLGCARIRENLPLAIEQGRGLTMEMEKVTAHGTSRSDGASLQAISVQSPAEPSVPDSGRRSRGSQNLMIR
jgi:hypothetical protein